MQGTQLYISVGVIFLILFPSTLTSLDPGKPIDQYLLGAWKMSDGLPSDTIRAITQTDDGYLWMAAGSKCILVRFDGLTFTPFKNECNQKIKNSTIYNMLLAENGVFWIGTANGLSQFQTQNGFFENFSGKDEIKENAILASYLDKQGRIWLGLDNGFLIRYKTGKFKAFDAKMGTKNNLINCILEDSKGNLWLGTSDCGLLKFHEGRLSRHSINGIEHHYSITSLYEDENGNLWVGTNCGLIKMDDSNAIAFTTKDGLSNNCITSILETQRGCLWFGTLNGLNRLKENFKDEVIIEKILDNDVITSLFQDREKNLWIGTNGSGLKCFKDCQIRTYTSGDGLNKDFLLSLFEDRDGDIWIGSSMGVNRFDGDKFTNLKSLQDKIILSIDGDKKGSIWMGDYGKGILRISDGQITYFSEDQGFMANYVVYIHCDSKNRMWFGTEKGLILYRNHQFKLYSLKDSPGSNIVVYIYEDQNHNLWLGTYDGLYMISFKGNHRDVRDIKKYLKGLLITSIYEEPEGSFWIGTDGEGLKLLQLEQNGNRWYSFQTEQGLASNKIYKIVGDDNQRLWMSSDQGIMAVDRMELNDMIRKKLPRFNCALYGLSDGMKNPECIYSAIKTGNNELWFATKKGIAVFRPDKMKKNLIPPSVIIEKVQVNRQVISKILNPSTFRNAHEIEIFFTAPTFIVPERVRFKFKLEGYDDRWHWLYPSQKRSARYKDLLPGNYRFNVIACNRDGIWNNIGDSFSFEISPSFYRGGLFKIFFSLSMLVLGLLLLFLLRNNTFFKKKYKNSSLDAIKTEKYVSRLVQLMDNEKLYKDNNLSLQLLAKKLSITPKLLSQLINEQLGKNYANFINHYRIEEAKQMLSDKRGKRFSILAIAYEVGFNSKAVFNRAFKKFTGMAPRDYRKSFASKKK